MGACTSSLRGELDLATAPELERLLEERGGDEVVVDLRALEFMDSSGVRVLVAGHALAGREGGRLAIVRPRAGQRRWPRSSRSRASTAS